MDYVGLACLGMLALFWAVALGALFARFFLSPRVVRSDSDGGDRASGPGESWDRVVPDDDWEQARRAVGERPIVRGVSKILSVALGLLLSAFAYRSADAATPTMAVCLSSVANGSSYASCGSTVARAGWDVLAADVVLINYDGALTWYRASDVDANWGYWDAAQGAFSGPWSASGFGTSVPGAGSGSGSVGGGQVITALPELSVEQALQIAGAFLGLWAFAWACRLVRDAMGSMFGV